MTSVRRAGLAAALAATPVALAWRFALAYRLRAGFPQPRSPAVTPADLGLPFESVAVAAPGATLAAWFIPARGGRPGPGIVVVHGWESGRDRTLPLTLVLHAAGFHVLAVDVRGHGANPPETLPVSAGEFGIDAGAAFDALLERPEITRGGIVGHSLGGIGAILAAAADPRVEALVATATPADPWRLTRQTFRLAHLPIPDPVAYPLAWLTARVFVRPRGHTVEAISASAGIARYDGPALLLHGSDDAVVPVGHLERLVRAARRARATRPDAAAIESAVIQGGQHSWLYELPAYRRAIAGFLARTLDGPLDPATAADVAAAVPARRLPDPPDVLAVRAAASDPLPADALPDEEPPVPEEPFNPLALNLAAEP